MAGKRLFAHAISNIPHLSQANNSSTLTTMQSIDLPQLRNVIQSNKAILVCQLLEQAC